MRIFRTGLLLSCIFIGSSVCADAPQEREQLRQVHAELVQLQQLLDKAEASADPDARIHFRYDWLRRDLAILRHGIKAHIDAANRVPASRHDIHGDYRR